MDQPTNEQRPTIHSVARAAGVSRQTVSNAMNAPHRVRPDTLERVRSAIDSLGYRPNAAARQMRTGRSNLLALRLDPHNDGINGSVGDRFLHALAESAKRAGCRIILSTATDVASELDDYADLVATSALDGVILTGTVRHDPRRAWLAEAGVAFVSFGRPWELGEDGAAAADHHWVDVDGAAGTRAAVEQLVSLGHRRIAYLGWPVGSDVGDDRRSGWAGAVAEHLTDEPASSAVSPDDFERARSVAAELIGTAHPTAVVCASDTLAIAVAAEVTASGRTVGEHLSVVGFDDTPAARTLGLASVRQPLELVADACVTRLVQQLSGQEEAAPELFAPELVARASLARPRSAPRDTARTTARPTEKE